MAGFIRRFDSAQGADVVQQIEGVVIYDLPPPGTIQGVGTGVVGLVGEFADMGLAVSVSSGGVVSTDPQPTEVFSGQDIADRFGGFDASLGNFGTALGNGFVALQSKRFSRLVLAAVNLCSAQGARFWRSLPMCRSTTDATPVVPVTGAAVAAGREFRNGSGRVKAGTRVAFTARPVLSSGVNGACAVGASAATQVFNADAGFDWTLVDRGDGNLGARKGDVLVIGRDNAGAVAPAAEAGTYRVVSDPASGVAITVERLDGAAFAFTAQSNVPWRLHHSTDADSARERVVGQSTPGGYAYDDAGGATVPVRPITNSSGGLTTGTYTAGTLLSPAVAPPALTGDTWDVLSGLGGSLHPVTATDFTATTQLSNAANDAAIDALYGTALDAFLGAAAPVRDVNILVSARKSSNIRTALKATALSRSADGKGLAAIVSPQLSTQTTVAATADSDPGVGGARSESVFYAWPGVRFFVRDAVDSLLATADGDFTDGGTLDDTSDVWLASVLSNLAPERNPGQSASPVPALLAGIVALQRGAPALVMADYIAMRAAGICGPRIDPSAGPIFQSGVTTSLTSGQKNINRRRMAWFIQDSLAVALNPLSKLPLTEDLKDTVLTEVTAFLEGLLSRDNPKAQRISAYSVDGTSGNTPTLEASGIYVVIVKVRSLSTADDIVLQTEIGENVVTTTEV